MALEITGGARISPITIKPDMKIKILDEQEIEKLHAATLVVLKKTGVRFPCKKALDIFAQAGADVDFKKEIVKIQPDLLIKTLAKAPTEFVMGSRGNQELDMNLDGTKIYCGTAGTGTATVDIETRKRRPSVKEDIAMMALISDYLSSISFYWPMVAARDCPPQIIALHELEAAFTYTEKHVHIVSCVDKKSAQYAVEMAGVITGSKERIKARPPLSLIASPISPLNHDTGVLEAALVFAGAGLPVGFAAMPVIGTTAPASIAGALILGNAEILSSICLLQLAYPGSPAFYPLFTAMMNPYTGGISVSNETKYPFYAATVQLGHHYNLPVMTGYGGSDATDPKGWNVGKDDAIDAFFGCAVGPDMAPGLGLLEGCNVCYAGDSRGVPIRCTQNPTMGEEWRRGWHPEFIPQRQSDDAILVVGAGPAGLEAARALGQRGYKVTLAEATKELGGRVTVECRLPGLTEWRRVIEYRIQQIKRMRNIDVYLDSRLTAKDVFGFGYSRIIVATGSRWRRDGVARWHTSPVKGFEGQQIFTPDDLFADVKVSGPVVLYDDDHYYMGAVLAEKLQTAGLEVSLVTPAGTVGEWSFNTEEQERTQKHF